MNLPTSDPGTSASIEIHPVCHIMPQMSDEEFQKLKDDIAGMGLREPITLFAGKIIDGLHRFRACMELGIEPVFENFVGGESLESFVFGKNLYRRHLNASQRAMVAAKGMEFHREEAKERQREAGRKEGAHGRYIDVAKTPNKVSATWREAVDDSAIAEILKHGCAAAAKMAERTSAPQPRLHHTLRIGGVTLAHPGDRLISVPEAVLEDVAAHLAEQDDVSAYRLSTALREAIRYAGY